MIPTTIQAGITVSWTAPVPDGLAAYEFQYVFQGPSTITVSAAVVGNELTVNETATTTAAWAPGYYKFQLLASLADDRCLVSQGSIQINPNFANLAAGHDFRSHAQRMLDAINQVLEGRITKDVEQYEIDGRSVTRIPILELQKLKRTYSMKVLSEKRKESGRSSFQPKTVKPRFRK